MDATSVLAGKGRQDCTWGAGSSEQRSGCTWTWGGRVERTLANRTERVVADSGRGGHGREKAAHESPQKAQRSRDCAGSRSL